jgi:acid phosphatase
VFSILLGGAVPENLQGTSDNNFYTHYSSISSVAVSWGLPSLGRWDCGANVFQIVADKAQYHNAQVDVSKLYFNSSYPGPVSDTQYKPVWPAPVTIPSCASGQGVLESVVQTWHGLSPTYNYTNAYPYDTASGNNADGTPVHGSGTFNISGSQPGSSSGSHSGSHMLSKGKIAAIAVLCTFAFVVFVGVMIFLVYRRYKSTKLSRTPVAPYITGKFVERCTNHG